MIGSHREWKKLKTDYEIPTGVAKANIGQLLDKVRAAYNDAPLKCRTPVEKLQYGLEEYKAKLDLIRAQAKKAKDKPRIKQLDDFWGRVDRNFVQEVDAVLTMLNSVEKTLSGAERRLLTASSDCQSAANKARQYDDALDGLNNEKADFDAQSVKMRAVLTQIKDRLPEGQPVKPLTDAADLLKAIENANEPDKIKDNLFVNAHKALEELPQIYAPNDDVAPFLARLATNSGRVTRLMVARDAFLTRKAEWKKEKVDCSKSVESLTGPCMTIANDDKLQAQFPNLSSNNARRIQQTFGTAGDLPPNDFVRAMNACVNICKEILESVGAV